MAEQSVHMRFWATAVTPCGIPVDREVTWTSEWSEVTCEGCESPFDITKEFDTE